MGIDRMRAGGHSGVPACSGQDLVVQALQGGATAQGFSKKNDDKIKIAICLKKKPIGGRNRVRSSSTLAPVVATDTPTDASVLPTASLVQKKHKVDMDKWSQRGKTPTEVKRTAQGKPICILCKRKFANVKKLRQHEKLSPLHKQNLLKKKLQQLKTDQKKSLPKIKADTNDTLSMEYRDRAKERRSMYGPESASLGISPGALNSEAVACTVEMGPSLTNARLVTAVETITPSQNLGETNIGNQLLQKLGWTKGSSLGRSNGTTGGMEMMDPNGKNEGNKGSSTTMAAADKLKQDWERIESLATGGGGNGNGNGRGNRRY